MGRIHLFEFEDLPWFPGAIRNYATDFLQFLSNKAKIYTPTIPLILNALEKERTDQIVDLGSGGGGGFIWLSKELAKEKPDLKILLTDFYPNKGAFAYTKQRSPVFDFIEEPVDAREVPENLKGLRTQFLSLHHFREEDARKILQNALDANTSIAVFEAQERSLPSILAMLLSPISVLLTTPFIRPFKLGRIIFTYLIPIVPLVILWDGVVSSLRTYSVKEMNALVASLENADKFEWNIGKVKSGPGVVLYLVGTKQHQ